MLTGANIRIFAYVCIFADICILTYIFAYVRVFTRIGIFAYIYLRLFDNYVDTLQRVTYTYKPNNYIGSYSLLVI